MTLYVDVLFAINFSMDFLSLFICSVIMHKKIYKGRILISSVIGGLYSIFDMLYPTRFVFKAIICVAISFLMCIITFKDKSVKGFIGFFVMYWGVSTGLGGVMSLLYSFMNKLLADFIADYSYEGAYNGARFLIIVSLTSIISMALSKMFTAKKSIKSIEVAITYENKCFKLNGLCDSGNTLTEPISGKPVILVSEDSEIGRMIKNTQEIHKKFIPYKAVGNEGMLLGIKPKAIVINDITIDAILAPVREKNFSGFEALVPSSLV